MLSFTFLSLTRPTIHDVLLNSYSYHLPKKGHAEVVNYVNIRTGPSVDATLIGHFDAGDSLDYDSTFEVDGKKWISWLTSSGVRQYCGAYDTNDGYQYIKASDLPADFKPYKSEMDPLLLPIPQYYQWNYGDYQYGPMTISSAGCGPTSFAMIASYLLDRTITPPDAIKWCGAEYFDDGTDYPYFAAAAQHFGCGSVTQTYSDSEALNALKNKRPIISNQGVGIFTAGGHYIVLRGLDRNGKVMVRDPNDGPGKNYINRHFNFYNEITEANRCYFIFQAK